MKYVNTDLKKMGWSAKEGAEDSLSLMSSLPDMGKPLWFIPLGAGTEMMGAGSWLGPACLEKLQENSGADAFLVLTQTGRGTKKKGVGRGGLEISQVRQTISSVLRLNCWLLNVTFLRRWREKLHFGGQTGEEVLQEEQCIL